MGDGTPSLRRLEPKLAVCRRGLKVTKLTLAEVLKKLPTMTRAEWEVRLAADIKAVIQAISRKSS